MIYYITYLLGEEVQTRVYTDCFKHIKDSQLTRHVNSVAQRYFKEELHRKFLKQIAEEVIYENDYQSRRKFLDFETQ